jgi:GT2 family glycosyltransferase
VSAETTVTPSVAVVIVAYRSRDHLPACLDALPAAADGIAYEVVVVDNASADGTPDLLAARFPGIRLLQNPTNRGFAAAANQGARDVSGRYLLFLNPDAVMAPGSLVLLVATLESDAALGMACPQLLNPDGSAQRSTWPEPGAASLILEALMLDGPAERLRALAGPAPRSRDVVCVSGASLVVRRTCWEALEGFDEGFFLYHEDFDFCLRARDSGFRIRFVPAARVTHALGASAFRDRGEFLLRFHESRARLLAKRSSGIGGAALRALHEAGLAVRVVAHGAGGWLSGNARLTESAGQHRAALSRARSVPTRV